MPTVISRNAEPSARDGVSRTKIPSGVLPLSGPPADPSQPSHSAICPRTYVRLNTVARTADHSPTDLVDGEIGGTSTLRLA
jgi:hypothetical protein